MRYSYYQCLPEGPKGGALFLTFFVENILRVEKRFGPILIGHQNREGKIAPKDGWREELLSVNAPEELLDDVEEYFARRS